MLFVAVFGKNRQEGQKGGKQGAWGMGQGEIKTASLRDKIGRKAESIR